MAHAEVNGQRLFYEDAGSGAPPIIWSHGLFMDHAMFAPQVAAFAAEHRCVSWDARGHGATVSTDAPFSYWDSAQDLVGLMDHLGIDRAVLAGTSQGGYVSLRAALADPDRVAGLILVSTQAALEDPDRLARYETLLEAWTESEDGLPDAVSDIVAQIILGDYERAAEWQARWREYDRAKVSLLYGALVSREHLEQRLAEIAVPAIVIHAADDAAIELPRAQRMAELLPDAEMAVMPGGGHACNLTRPDELNAHIARFLARMAKVGD